MCNTTICYVVSSGEAKKEQEKNSNYEPAKAHRYKCFVFVSFDVIALPNRKEETNFY